METDQEQQRQDEQQWQRQDEEFLHYALLLTLKRVIRGQSGMADALLLASQLGLLTELQQELDHANQ
jgi:hypothetical protein